jgi:hypothetical protein
LWLFVACLAVCSLHAEEQSLVVSESPSSAYALNSTESEDCCSVSDGQLSVIPERITVAWISTKAVRAISLSADLIFHTAHLHRPGQYSLAGPNVKLLGTLRI